MNVANTRFAIKSWDEKPYGEATGSAKTTRASVAKVYHGEIEGEGALEYLMAYAQDGSASFVGMERVVGRLGTGVGASFSGTSGRSRAVSPGRCGRWFPAPGRGICRACAAR